MHGDFVCAIKKPHNRYRKLIVALTDCVQYIVQAAYYSTLANCYLFTKHKITKCVNHHYRVLKTACSQVLLVQFWLFGKTGQNKAHSPAEMQPYLYCITTYCVCHCVGYCLKHVLTRHVPTLLLLRNPILLCGPQVHNSQLFALKGF